MPARVEALSALMQGFSRCMPGVFPSLAEAFTSYENTRTYPRYFMSPSYLTYDGGYYSAVVNNCLVLVRRKWLHGNPILYAVLPPISSTGNSAEEQTVIRELLQLGIGFRLSEEDLKHYCTFPAEVIRRPEVDEYVYDVNEVYKKEGGRFAGIRLACNRAMRVPLTHTSSQLSVFDPVSQDVTTLADDWEEDRNRFSGQKKLAAAGINNECTALLLYNADRLTAYRLADRVTKSWAVGFAHAWLPDSAYATPSLFVHWADCASWAEQGVTYYNFGRDGKIKGLRQQKETLRPCKILQISHLTPTCPVTAEEWKASQPNNLKAIYTT